MSQYVYLNILLATLLQFLKMKHFYTVQNKSNFLVLHNFVKCFSGTRVYQIENKCIVLSFQFIISGSVKVMFTKLLLNKEMDDAENY